MSLTYIFSVVICMVSFDVKSVWLQFSPYQWCYCILAFLMTRTWLEGRLKSSIRVASVNVCDGDHTVLQTIFISETCNSGTAGTSYSVTCDGPRASRWASATYRRFPQTYLGFGGRSTEHLKYVNTWLLSPLWSLAWAKLPECEGGRDLGTQEQHSWKSVRAGGPLNWICWKRENPLPRTTLSFPALPLTPQMPYIGWRQAHTSVWSPQLSASSVSLSKIN